MTIGRYRELLRSGGLCIRRRVMFRIAKGYDHVTKTIRIPLPLAEQLEQLAADNCISLNQLVNQCIQFALENQSYTDEAEHAETNHR